MTSIWHDKPCILIALGLLVIVCGSASICQALVNQVVTEPYLDEVFHVGQAQAYCRGELTTWDPKITTPPGLYILSWLSGAWSKSGPGCTLEALRRLNGAPLMGSVYCLAFFLRFTRSSQLAARHGLPKSAARRLYLIDMHTATNVALFPPLFFFSALYYTDISSTVVVLTLFAYATYRHYRMSALWKGYTLPHSAISTCLSWACIALIPSASLNSLPTAPLCLLSFLFVFTLYQSRPDLHNSRLFAHQRVIAIFIGAFALIFRQTNVFWVSIFPIGRCLVSTVVDGKLLPETSLQSLPESLRCQNLNRNIGEASFEDYIEFVYTFLGQLIVTMKMILKDRLRAFLLVDLATFSTPLILFGIFVIWNGGVVLGDKSNHVATIHIPQMLYIWPLMLFFSFPLVLPRAIGAILPWRILPSFLTPYYSPSPGRSNQKIIWKCVLMLFTLLAIHFNTIVHPFTLADNRHYVFYVFRILLRHPAIKYLVAPIYLICAWGVTQTLGLPAEQPITEPKARIAGRETERLNKPQATQSNSRAGHGTLKPTRRIFPDVRIGSYLVWLGTCTLCLISAPLVEPRYFIIPWIVWRLWIPSPIGHVDYKRMTEHVSDTSSIVEGGSSTTTDKTLDVPAQEGTKSRVHPQHGDDLGSTRLEPQWYLRYDHRLVVETIWFLIVNAVTGYIFLYHGFEWPHEPGRVQRFMW